MISRELADLCERAPGFDAETLKLLANTLRSQADEIDRLQLDVDILKSALHPEPLPCGHPGNYAYTEDGGRHIVCLICSRDNGVKAEQFAKDTDDGRWSRMKTAENEADGLRVELKRVRMVAVDEIDALKAEAIVRGSVKLDEAAKTALERERRAADIDRLRSEAILRGMQVKNLMVEIQRLKDVVRHAEYWEAVRKEERDAAVAVANQHEVVKAAWKQVNGERGWLERANQHDSRCRALFNTQEPKCTCGADDFRRLMEES